MSGKSSEPSAQTRTTQQVFEDIYRSAKWGINSEGVGGSGSGSLIHKTLIYRTFVQQFLKANQIRSVVDAGCGDWEFSQAIDWGGIDYRGFDIVEANIAHHTKKFAKHNVQFFTGDIVEMDLPRADLLLCKHVLQHLPTPAVLKFLAHLPNYKHALLTNGVNPKTMSATNIDIAPGEYRTLDPTAPPFNLQGIKVLTYWDGRFMHQVVHFANVK